MKYLNIINFINKNGNNVTPTFSTIQNIIKSSLLITNIDYNKHENILWTNNIFSVLNNITFSNKDVYVYGKTLEEIIIKNNMVKSKITFMDDNIISTEKFPYNENELPYLQLVHDVCMNNISSRMTRNAITISTFGPQLEFDLEKGFPLLTTKKMFWKGIINELLFILRGDTDATILKNLGINIWNDNTTREFLDSRKLDYKVGDMGPMYGYILRHQGLKYEGCDKKHEGGYDQLLNVINLLKNDPTSRRIMMTTFDPSQVEHSVLAPCHGLLIQFYVDNKGLLSCKMTQRSADIFLGLPFNIASYAALVHIIAHITGYSVGKLYISLGDAHIYTDHIDLCIKQLYRNPYPFPKLQIIKKIGEIDPLIYINELKDSDFEIVDYVCHPLLKGSMIA